MARTAKEELAVWVKNQIADCHNKINQHQQDVKNHEESLQALRNWMAFERERLAALELIAHKTNIEAIIEAAGQTHTGAT